MQPSPGPNDSAEQAWQRILTNPDHNGQTWACLAVALAHADDVIAHTARVAISPDDPAEIRAGPLWRHVAVSGYTMLMSTGAYRHLGQDLPGRLVADESAIRTWLRAPAPDPWTLGQTVADLLGVDENWLLDDGQRHARVAGLLAQAQAAGVLRCPNTRVQLWHVADDDGDLVGHRIGVVKGNATFASDQFDLTDIIDESISGVPAAVAVVKQAAERANQVLAIAAGTPVDRETAVEGFDPPYTREVPSWARGFRVGARHAEPTAGTATPAPPPDTAAPGATHGPTR
jgi:hypothetical protein